MLKYTLLESHLVKSNRIAPYFCPQSALIQAARQGLSARIRFANANMILNLALCFSSPRYRVFRKRSCFLTTPNTCSIFARTEDFACSAFFAAYWPLLLSFFTWDGRRLILYAGSGGAAIRRVRLERQCIQSLRQIAARASATKRSWSWPTCWAMTSYGRSGRILSQSHTARE